MTNDDRTEIIRELFAECLCICASKGEAYAVNDDSLSHFKETARRMGVTPFQSWGILFEKHVVSIENAIKRNPAAPVERTESLHGRILDAIVYLALLETLRLEKESCG
jgi:hypothetical protein